MSKLAANELEKIKKRYKKRNNKKMSSLYLYSNPYIYMSSQEKERIFFKIFKKHLKKPLSDTKILEIGCGRGYKILDLLRMGFSPEHIIGNELMPENIDHAKKLLPASIKLIGGDASKMEIEKNSIDIVYQSMVFSSILDFEFKKKLANRMWFWVKPGGAIIWYDFIYNNPNNKDVKGMPVKEINELFPHSKIYTHKVTLAPPLSRSVTKFHPSLYTVLNIFPFLRTHVICYIKKL